MNVTLNILLLMPTSGPTSRVVANKRALSGRTSGELDLCSHGRRFGAPPAYLGAFDDRRIGLERLAAFRTALTYLHTGLGQLGRAMCG